MKKKSKIVLIIIILLIAAVSGGIFFFRKPKGVTYDWVQTNWKDGVDTVNFPKHPDDKDRTWKKYYQKDEGIITLGNETEGELALAPLIDSLIQTTDEDFKFGIFASTTILGIGEGADITLACKGLDVTCWRKPITISNSGPALTNYQVLVTLDTAVLISAGRMQSDCDDIRFIDSNEKTLLNYWLESGCNTETTKVWVEIPYLPSGNKAIYLYYGNPLANSLSNGKETFLAFDWKFDGPIAISASSPGGHTCVLLSNGGVRCWGRNNYGQLGDGTLTERTTPVSVSDLTEVIAITAGRLHTCVLLSDKTVKCWGDNEGGQLGDATTIPRILPVSVSRLTNPVAIAAGDSHTCALLSNVTCCFSTDNFFGLYFFRKCPLFF